MRKLACTFCLLILTLLFSISLTSAATIQGEVYEAFGLEPLDNVVVSVNSTPRQSMVASDGFYSLQLPLGDYALSAIFRQDGKIIYSTQENITIIEEGEYVLDLLLTPTLDYNESLLDDDQDIDLNFDAFLAQYEGEQKADTMLQQTYFSVYTLVLLVLIVGAVLLLFLRSQGKEEKPQLAPDDSLPEDLAEMLSLIAAAGGRATQKELRIKLNYSEAKVSLMVADLEERGLVHKFKRGRGNIIRLVEAKK